MSGLSQLSNGCMKAIMSGTDFDKPILQILGSKKIIGAEGTERYRLLVSDGVYLNSFAMLATQLNNLITDGDLVDFSIVRIDRYITSMVNKSEKGNKRVLIILELTVLKNGSEIKTKIGHPVAYTEETASTVNVEVAKSAKSTSNVNKNNDLHKPKEANQSNDNITLNTSISNPAVTHPIASLTPYHNKWVIKARVTGKSTVRTWNNARGQGKLFSMDLMDKSGEIRATAFKELCDKYYDIIEVDKVYYISKCQLKSANKQFSTLKNDYEMTFTNETVVQPCEEDANGVPQVQYNFVPISDIANIEPKSTIDVIGVCREVGELQVFTGKSNNKEFKKKEITLVDSSNAAIQLTLWGDEAVNFNGYGQPVILVKSAVVSEFGGGKSLSVGTASNLKINPDISEGHKLRGWFDNGGGENINHSLSTRNASSGSFNTDWVTFHEMNAKKLGHGEKADYFQTKAVIQTIRSNTQSIIYKACPQCNKKLITDDMSYRCEKCNDTFPNFKYRLLMSMAIGDWSGTRWVTCFSEVVEQIIGKTAQEIGELFDTDPVAGEDLLASYNFNEFIFKLRAKVDSYGDMSRNKVTVMNATPINYAQYNKYLISNLKTLIGIGKN